MKVQDNMHSRPLTVTDKWSLVPGVSRRMSATEFKVAGISCSLSTSMSCCKCSLLMLLVFCNAQPATQTRLLRCIFARKVRPAQHNVRLLNELSQPCLSGPKSWHVHGSEIFERNKRPQRDQCRQRSCLSLTGF